MSTASINTEQKVWKVYAKKAISGGVTALAASLITAVLMLIPFYYKTTDSIPVIKEDISKLNTQVENLEKQSEGPMVDGKLNSQRLDDLQRQIYVIKDDVKEIKVDIKSLYDGQKSLYDGQQKLYEGQQKMYEMIVQINQNTKK